MNGRTQEHNAALDAADARDLESVAAARRQLNLLRKPWERHEVGDLARSLQRMSDLEEEHG